MIECKLRFGRSWSLMDSWLLPGSDPRAGTPPSVINHREILRSTSLYYLTESFTSAAFIYYANPHGFRSEYTRAPTDAPLLFSSFKYNVGFWPKAFAEKVGNLVYYKSKFRINTPWAADKLMLKLFQLMTLAAISQASTTRQLWLMILERLETTGNKTS